VKPRGTVFGIDAKLILAFSALALLTALASAVAWLAFVEIDRSATRVTSRTVPGMVTSLSLAAKSAEIATTAPALMASGTQEQRMKEAAALEGQARVLATLIAELHRLGVAPQRTARLSAIQDEIAAALGELNESVARRLEIADRRNAVAARLWDAHTGFLEALEPAVDDAGFDLILSSEALTKEGADRIADLVEGGVDNLHAILTLRAEGNLAAGVLAEAAGVTDAALLQPLQERFTAAHGHIDRMLARLSAHGNATAMQEAVYAVVSLGLTEESIFEVRRSELRQIAAAQELLEANRVLANNFGNEVASVVATARRASDEAAGHAADAVRRAKSLTIMISIAGILGAASVVLFYVRPRIVRPLENITDAMTQIAAGDTSVDIPWRHRTDEMGRMAQALGIFRDTAIEIQESNRKEIYVTRRRLSEAIESLTEGFTLYDCEDRLVVCNGMYRALLHPDDGKDIVPGMSFETIARRAAERGDVDLEGADIDEWVRQRVARHHNPEGPHLQHRRDDRWILISERKTDDGGTVAVYSDITALKQRETELAEKSRALENLSKKLAKYLSPQVYSSIFTGRQEVTIASQRKKLTVFFSDIAGFTETADRLESEDLTHILNHYLTEMSQIALAYGATIDKYVGDAIVIFFGDPETQGIQADALACVRMAIAMRNRMGELADIWRDAGIENPLKCRIGINTGFCTVGNFGSEDRMDYTIIGGGVNLASRLEQAATPGDILVSYETLALIKDEIHCEEHGRITVKGIAYPVASYRVVDSYDNLGARPQIIREVHPKVKLNIDLSTISAEERNEIATILKRTLGRLSEEGERKTS
jgi:class 3 adenylate cyclase/HAMP domain-containing protein